MNIQSFYSKLNNITFCADEKNIDNDKVIKPDFNKNIETEGSSLEALESQGRAQVINLPKKKRSPENIAELLDRTLIARNNEIIVELESGYNRFLYATPENSLARLRKENEVYETLKSLDSKRYLGKIPKSAYIHTVREHIQPEILNKNIETLNGMDEKLIEKLNFGLLNFILRKPDLEEKLHLLSTADDNILKAMPKAAVMDFILDTDICSKTAQDIELFKQIYEAAKYGDFSSIDFDGPKPADVIDFNKTNDKK